MTPLSALAAFMVSTRTMGRIAQAPPRSIPRVVLVLYNSAEGVGIRDKGLPSGTEMVLNYLGLIARPIDVAKESPPAFDPATMRGVITLFDGDKMPHARAYCRWLDTNLLHEVPTVILGSLGAISDAGTGEDVSSGLIDSIYRHLGLEDQGDWTADPRVLRIVAKSPLMEFERPLAPPDYFEAFRSIDPRNHVLLRLERTDTGQTSAEAILGPRRAFVAGTDYVAYQNPIAYTMQWRINPFSLYASVLGTQDLPEFDTTTASGRRIFYSHIDGDGFSSVSELAGHPLAAEVIRDRVLRTVDLPVTASVIAAEIKRSPHNAAVARSIFALPNVEAGSHSYTHPFDWVTGSRAFREDGSDFPVTRDRKAPRLRKARLDLDLEIFGSIAYIDTLLPKGKKVAIFQWSGATNPTAAALRRTYQAGVENINGGDNLIDPDFPSYLQWSPLSLMVGPYRQIYSSNANENLYTNLWTGPYYGYRDILRSYRFSEAPRRIAPINIYYHYYSGVKQASLDALLAAYHWAQRQHVIGLFASEYARTVRGFFSATIDRLAAPPGSSNTVWHLAHYGACQTVRLDDPGLVPDLSHSSNVAGYRRHGSVTYITLGPDDGQGAVLALETSPSSAAQSQTAGSPYLREANALVARLQTGRQGMDPVHLVLRGHQPVVAEVQSWPGHAIRVRAGAAWRTLEPGPDGIVRVRVPQTQAELRY